MRDHRAALAVLCLALLLPLLLTGCQGPYASGHLLFLIAERDEGFYWENLLQGASLAAKDNGWTLESAFLSKGENLDDLLAQAGERGAETIALALLPEHLPADYAYETPLILMGADWSHPRVSVRVFDENTIIGKRVGQLLAKRIGLQKNLMLVTTTETYVYDDEWETALRNELGMQGSQVVSRVNCADNANLAYARCRWALEAHPEIEGIVCSSENATTGALRAVRSLGVPAPIIGADFNSNIALGLRDGLLCLTVVRNAYACGYMGVENAIRLSSGKSAAVKKQLDAVYVDADNLFDDEMRVFLFDVD